MGTPEPDKRETDRLLEQELREAVGEDAAERAMEHADDVRAAHATPGTPAASGRRGRRPDDAPGSPDGTTPRGTLTSWLTRHGPPVAVTFAVFLTIGVIVALATGSWWALVAALAVHAAGTLVVATAALRLTTETEHVTPALAARLEAEGVADPDRAFTELAAGPAGPGDVLREGDEERTSTPEQDAAREQRAAMTPGSEATAPSDGGAAIGLMPAAVVAGSLLVALVAAIVVGGAMWAAAGVAWAAGIVWLALQRGVRAGRGAFAAALLALVVAVAVFGVLMGLIGDEL